MVYLDQRQVGFALSVPVSPGLMQRMQELDEASWHLEREDEGALRHWEQLDYLPAAALGLRPSRTSGHRRGRDAQAREPPHPSRPRPHHAQCRRHALSQTAETSGRRHPTPNTSAEGLPKQPGGALLGE